MAVDSRLLGAAVVLIPVRVCLLVLGPGVGGNVSGAPLILGCLA